MDTGRTNPGPPLVVIAGPTGVGKTAAAVHVARAVGGEIISADSVAVYRGLDIGAAKPTPEERASARFHLVDILDLDQSFTVAAFNALAEEALTGIRERGHRPIIVGGTGLYIRALIEDFSLTGVPPDLALRSELDEEARRSGAPALHARLVEVDPVAASRIHPNDRVRIVRALEASITAGRPISAQHAEDAARRQRRPAHKFALTMPREELYRRIDARVDRMVEAGLEREVRTLLEAGYDPSLRPLRSLGYKEMVACVTGEVHLAEAVAAIKRETRRFAKRQYTWFRAEPDLDWIDVSGMSPEQAAGEVISRLPA